MTRMKLSLVGIMLLTALGSAAAEDDFWAEPIVFNDSYDQRRTLGLNSQNVQAAAAMQNFSAVDLRRLVGVRIAPKDHANKNLELEAIMIPAMADFGGLELCATVQTDDGSYHGTARRSFGARPEGREALGLESQHSDDLSRKYYVADLLFSAKVQEDCDGAEIVAFTPWYVSEGNQLVATFSLDARFVTAGFSKDQAEHERCLPFNENGVVYYRCTLGLDAVQPGLSDLRVHMRVKDGSIAKISYPILVPARE